MASAQQRRFGLMLVDDEPAILGSLKRVFRKAPYTIVTAGNGLEALKVLQSNAVDAALVDVRMPKMDGMQLLEKIQSAYPRVKVVMLSGYGGVRESVQAIHAGAVDFLQKPFEAETIDARINQRYHIWRLERENRRLKKRVQFQSGFDQLIGNSAVMLKLKKMILQVAESDASGGRQPKLSGRRENFGGNQQKY